MSTYSPLIRRSRTSCLVYFYYAVGLFLIWSTYFVLKATDPANAHYIYFVETSEPKHGTLQLTPRQACAVESAAIANPYARIQLYVTGVSGLKPWQERGSLWSIILSLPNVEVKFINLTEHLAETPLVKIIESNRLDGNPEWITWHKSDLLRFALLWKRPGVYLDLDVISIRSVRNLGSTWLVHEHRADFSPIQIGGSVMRLGSDDTGRNMINNIVGDLAQNYDGELWADSSVGVLTRASKKQCNGKGLTAESLQECDGLKVWPADEFFAVPWEDYNLIFDVDRYEEAMKLVNQSVGVHLWNYATWELTVDKDKRVLINELAKRYCPAVYDMVDSYL